MAKGNILSTLTHRLHAAVALGTAPPQLPTRHVQEEDPAESAFAIARFGAAAICRAHEGMRAPTRRRQMARQRHLQLASSESCLRMSRKKSSKSTGGGFIAATQSRGSGWLTRKQVGERLGMAENSVKRRDGIDFHPALEGRFFFYDPAEVDAYGRRRGARAASPADGEIAARAFELFKAGRDFRDVVIELKQTPAHIRDLFHAYAEGLGVLVSLDRCRAIEELGLLPEGVSLTAEALVTLVRSLEEANGRISARSVEDYNQISHLRGALERASHRIAELDTELRAARQRIAEFEGATNPPILGARTDARASCASVAVASGDADPASTRGRH
jgi:hypothetical protein